MDTEQHKPEQGQDENADLLLAARERARLALQSKWLGDGPTCAVCGHDDWTVGDVSDLPVRLPGSEAGTVLSAQRVYPLIPLTCTTCGQVLFFNPKFLFSELKPTATDTRIKRTP
jgi:hypothetical protein